MIMSLYKELPQVGSILANNFTNRMALVCFINFGQKSDKINFFEV